MNRRSRITDQIIAWGYGNADRTDLAGDASFRRYERLRFEDTTAVLMDAPPPTEDTRPFIAVATWLADQGFSAPRIIAADIDAGIVLIEDLGDDSYTRVLNRRPDLEFKLYSRAVDLLAELHAISPPAQLKIPGGAPVRLKPYDRDSLMVEAKLLSDWYIPEVIGPIGDRRLELEEIWKRVIEPVSETAEVVTLRDYHADNLMWLPNRSGVAAVGLLDFQDAVAGHPAYDLVSLLQDARRDVPPALEKRMIEHYLARRAAQDRNLDPVAFRRAYSILGAQRNAKIVGIFTRLWKRDRKSQYLALIPHVWRMLERNLVAPELGELKAWLDRSISQTRRQKVLTPS